MQATAAQLGHYHHLVSYITEENALLCLSSAHSGNQLEFDFVMSYICTHSGAMNPPGGFFAIFCTDRELVRRCLRWMIDQLSRRITDDDDDSATTQPLQQGDNI